MKLFKLTCAAALAATALVLPISADAPYVAYWSFDNDGVEEINGYQPDNPEALTLAEGKNGKAFAGAGEDGAGIVYYDDVDIPLTTNFTAACWAKGSYDVEAGDYYVFMSKNVKGGDGHFEFYWFPNGNFGNYGTNGSGEATNMSSAEPWDDGEWHHFCVRVEDTEYILYVDGELDATYSGEALVQAPGTLSFGGLEDGTLPAQTLVDDMFFTNTLIPEEDIAKLMEDTKSYAYTLAGKEGTVEEAAPAAEEAAPAAEEAAPAAEEAAPAAEEAAPAAQEAPAPAEEVTTPAPAEEVPAPAPVVTTAPQTFDFGGIAAVSAIVSACGYALSKKRR